MILLGAYRRVPEESFLHRSVFERLQSGVGYCPQNLPMGYAIVELTQEVRIGPAMAIQGSERSVAA